MEAAVVAVTWNTSYGKNEGDGSDDPISKGNGITQNRPQSVLTIFLLIPEYQPVTELVDDDGLVTVDLVGENLA